MNATFPKLAGIALIVLAVTAPLTYCTIEQNKEYMVAFKICMEAKGSWWPGNWRCTLPEPKQAEAAK